MPHRLDMHSYSTTLPPRVARQGEREKERERERERERQRDRETERQREPRSNIYLRDGGRERADKLYSLFALSRVHVCAKIFATFASRPLPHPPAPLQQCGTERPGPRPRPLYQA